MRFYSYFNTAIKILRSYDGSIPLSHFLKQYFSENKKHGSKDRKFIAHACYCYFRLGQALKEFDIEERSRVSIFLCNDDAGGWNVLFDEEWLEHWSSSIDERLAFIASKYDSFSPDDVFPFLNRLSEGIEMTSFIESHFIQPDVFLRIRPHCQQQVINALQQNNISFTLAADDCIELPPNINAEKILKLDEEVVVQDYSSQQIKKYLQLVESEMENRKSQIVNRKSVWDCCAGSGGKSILAYDVLENIELTATDIRPSIIHNLEQRFKKAGIKNFKSFVIDLTNTHYLIPNTQSPIPNSFDLIICDAPCTGSGTWSRTPEQLFFFQERKIDEYAALQKKIAAHALGFLKPNGYFLYITCSVFRNENEEVAEFIKSQFHLQLRMMELLKGYDKKADTMFVALFQS